MCAPIKETCLIGPDTIGNFATSEVQPSYASSCDRDKCTCSSHEDYAETAQARLATAIAVHEIQQGKTFESGIDESLIIDADAPQPEKQPVTPTPADETPSEPVPEPTNEDTTPEENTTTADETTTPIAPEPIEKIEEEEKPKIEDFANDSDFIDALIDNKIQETEEENAEDAGTDFGTVNLSDLSFNGYNLL